MKKIQEFYDRTLDSLAVSYTEDYFYTSFGETHCLLVGDPEKPKLCTIHGGNGITTLNLDSKHLPTQDAMVDICKQAAEFLKE